MVIGFTSKAKTGAGTRPKTGGDEGTWYWVLALVGLTFLFVYLFNNVRPIIDPLEIPGFVSTPVALPSDADLVPLGEEELYYEEEPI